jgi:hypothetical protein
MRLRSWKRINKGSLIGFASVSLPIGGVDLQIDDLPVLEPKGRALGHLAWETNAHR